MVKIDVRVKCDARKTPILITYRDNILTLVANSM